MNHLSFLRNLLYILQVEEYEPERFLRWVSKHDQWEGLEQKKHLIWTAKAKSVFILAVFLWILAFPLLLFPRLAPYFLLAALSAFGSFDSIGKGMVIGRASSLLKSRPELIRIGITGSFGKTSTKEAIAAILSAKFQVLKTPENINTPVGIARFLLENLRPDHRVLVVEMGAYQKGDIKRLCDLIKPSVGVITGITTQHLERFGSLQNIVATKAELLESLPEDGAAILPADNTYTKEMVRKSRAKTTHWYSLSGKADARGSTIRFTKGGTRFRVKIGGKEFFVDSQWLGRGAVSNILAAFLVGRKLGIPSKEMAAKIANLPPIPHRLQLIPGPVTVLDDTYNSNPEGARMALEVLESLPGRKIVVAQGFVEMGEAHKETHKELGKQIEEVADLSLLVGPFANDIRAGMKHPSRIRIVPNLSEAQKILSKELKSGDIVSFQNDLPDNY
jgi:UDP-N-acetylmuramoyl-tripeptide--D-alanyl-D-alanine ligase